MEFYVNQAEKRNKKGFNVYQTQEVLMAIMIVGDVKYIHGKGPGKFLRAKTPK